jgi:outer membrane protein OmpA-like peptidoglycan-associated protein
MSSSLLDSLTGLITPDVVGRAASYFGESEGTVSKGLGAVLPLLLGGVATRASDQGFANTLFELVSSRANDDNVSGNLAALLSPSAATSPIGSLGGRLLSSLFGGNLGSVGSALANYSGGKPATGGSLLSLAAPLVLSVLGRAVRGGGLNASSLAGLLTEQKSSILGAVPGPLANFDRFLAAPAPAAATTPAAEPERSPILRWIIVLLIALLAIWLLSKIFGRREEPIEEPTPPAAVEPAPVPAPTDQPTPTESTSAIGAPSATLYFDVGSANLPADSTGGLEPVIAYLKANPSRVAVLSGYHDASGDAATNEALAKERAEAVRNALEGAGIEPARIDLQKPVVTTGDATADDARRVEVTVR